ncbi:benzoylformate decarboxylase [Croceicoccus bisphenolivorans]|uniref:benzoylformate decarboxylase n=1 Tax=Croceicoccus bisphenolivorans TaxID=1783232 RepID=UPI00082F70A4|nr:benzoylformate decarboxylase [Croceicoccus bisphenolivorans]
MANLAQRKMTVRDATLALMREFGMTTIFGNPGSTELPLFRDFPDDFRYVLGLQESVAMGMADGFAQATRNAAFVNLHASAGVGHSLGNLFTAYRNYTPLVVTAGQQARSILPYEPFLYSQQAVDFPKPFVKWSIEPTRAQDVPAAIARAYYIAMQRPRGPVFVSIPVDDWDQECEPLAARKLGTEIRGDADVIAAVADALSSAKHPAIVVGAGVARDAAWSEVIALAEQHEAPVWVAPMSARNSFPENHRLFAGFLSAGREAIVSAMDGSDVIVVLGGPMSLYHTEGFGPHVPDGAQLFQLVDDPSMASWTPTGMATVTNLKSGITEVIARSRPPKRAARPPRAAAPVLDGSAFTDSYLLQQIARVRRDGAIIVEEAPSSRGPMHDYLPILEEDGFYTCSSGGLGHGLPASIGVALGRPGEKVIAVLGDGSAMYAIQGLWTAAQLDLPISFVIINNKRYEALIGFGRHFGMQETVGTKLPDIGFCDLARGQGLEAMRVERPEDLDQALAASFDNPRPNLVEVVVE